jgi:hypothetical protein
VRITTQGEISSLFDLIKGCGFLLENDVSTMLHVITQRIENFDHGKGLVAKCIKVTFTSDLIS